MTFLQSLAGMLTLELTSADPEKVLDSITKSRISLYHVEKITDLTCRLVIRRKDMGSLEAIAQKQGASLKILGRHGQYWKINSLWARPVLLGLILVLFASAWYLPGRIFFVTVTGNERIPEGKILEAAENCGIGFGASRRKVRSEKMKNALLSAVPELQWAGINTAGCTAEISVRERAPEKTAPEKGIFSNLIADRDGYILSATVTGGTAQVSPGQTVTRGQLLISGYTDCGICIRASRAEGEILAQTNRELRSVMPENCLSAAAEGTAKYRISLLIGKKRINLWKDSRISDAGCGRMYTEYYLSLPGDFRLPAAICVDRYQTYGLQTSKIQPREAESMLTDFSEKLLLRQMVAGQIISRKQHLSCEGGRYLLEGSYLCREIIGREQREQIGVINEQRS